MPHPARNPDRTEVPPATQDPVHPESPPREIPTNAPGVDNPQPDIPHPGGAPTTGTPEEWPGG